LRYQPLPRLSLKGKLAMVTIGRDTASVNWGSNVLKNNTTRKQEFGNTIGQGISNEILLGTFTASYQVKHNLFLDASFLLRKSTSVENIYNNNTSVSSLALRWNIPQRLYEF
jgi:hypothetical protein